MRSSKIFIISSLFLILSNMNYAQAYDLVRLNCTMPRHEDVPERNFQFTLDENNGTVSFYVEDANETNKEKAFFGDDNVTWSNNIGFVKIKRVISRSNLTLTETTDIGGNITEQIGKCSIVKKKKNKF